MITVIGTIALLALLQLQLGIAQNCSPLVSVSLEQLKGIIHDEVALLRAELLEMNTIMQHSLCINHTGEIRMCAGKSCKEILEEKPDRPSGYYWLKACNTCEPIQAFCDFNLNLEGAKGWMRVVDLDMTDHSQQCPSQFKLITSPKRLCGRNTDAPGCDSTIFETYNIQYRKVAGRAIGYPANSVDAFNRHAHCPACNINQPYVDGVSITHGYPRNHIWTYAASDRLAYCPCVIGNSQLQPSYVGNDYYCEIGSDSDPLWDGEGCSGKEFPCCQSVHKNSGWFVKELSVSTTDGIEVRLCTDEILSNEDIRVERIELYIQ